MSDNTPSREIRTLGYVLRRTNYGEADRILNIITPLGKMTAIAKSVRKSKSKLAGGIEMFSLIDFNIHQGRSEFGTITGAKMLKYFDDILKDYSKMELAGMILKKVSRAAESSNSPEYFNIVNQCLHSLNSEMNIKTIETWFLINILKAMGEEMNLYRDIDGRKLDKDRRYDWDVGQEAFFENMNGEYGVDEIKMMRLMSTMELNVIKRVKVEDGIIERSLRLARLAAKT